ncbi:MAG: hypothetical protein IPM29_13830 [Planctomycetes bacterium]|nr:hypothetical protein [Planctomycetota bacterium]
MKKKFRDLLHAYKVDAHRITHSGLDDGSQEQLRKCIRETLEQPLEFHFHKEPSPERLETFAMIKNYTTEAVLPPVVEKIMRRVVQLERQQKLLVELMDGLLEAISEDLQAAEARAAAGPQGAS